MDGRNGRPYKDSLRWGISGVRELLSGGSGLNLSQVSPIQSIEDLKTRFHLALLSKNARPASRRWRAELGICVDGEITLPYRHYRPFDGVQHCGYRLESDIRSAVTRMLSTKAGAKLAVSFNSTHTKAQTVHAVEIAIDEGFEFNLRYGFNAMCAGQTDSEWTETLARTEGKETFVETLARADALLQKITAVGAMLAA